MLRVVDNAILTIIGYMKELASVLTWPIFLTLVALTFKSELLKLVSALIKRIEQGSSLKVGPLEVGEFKQSTFEEKQEKIIDEVKENAEGVIEEQGLDRNQNDIGSFEKAILAEALSLSKIESEDKIRINRNSKVAGHPLDGTCVLDDEFRVYECKYVIELNRVHKNIFKYLNQIFKINNDIVGKMMIPSGIKVKYILVLIYDRNFGELEELKFSINSEIREKSSMIDIKVMFFSFSDLISSAGTKAKGG